MIFVTGGTGLLGSHLLFELTRENKPIRALKRPFSNLSEVTRVFGYYTDSHDDLFSKIEWVDGDILNYADMLELLQGIDSVYHCAAMVSFDPTDRNRMIKNNRQGTANIVNAALERDVKKVCHVSSTSAIGQAPDDQLANESMIWAESKSNTGYSISKFKSEMEVWRAIEEGLSAVIVNPSIILGPGFWERGSSSIFSRVDKGLTFYSNGVTGYVGVWDVVKVMIRLMESDITGERFLVTAENLTYKEMLDMVADAMDKKRPAIEATRFMTELIWRLDWFRGLFSPGERVFTRERIRAARHVARFDNNKVIKTIDFEFEPVKNVIEKVAAYYLKG